MRQITTATVLALLLSSAANAGTLVVSGDEWTLSDNAYQGVYTASTNALVTDLMAKFGGTNYLLLTGNGNVNGAALTGLTGQLQGAGKTVTQLAAVPVSLAGYDAVFHFGQIVTPADFQAYVQGGGNAYVSLGGGLYGSAAAEAAQWNPMFGNFGLVAGNTWFTAPAFVTATVTSGPVGVTDLLWGFGQSTEITGAPGQSYVRGSFGTVGADIGLLGFASTGAVPEPSTWALLIAGFGVVGGAMRSRRRAAIRFA